jgi:adenosylcobinamide-phosphate guanylyltransferase
MEGLGEKPLVRIGGIPMYKRVLTALQGSRYIEEIVVATSPHTPDTTKDSIVHGIRVIVTPGDGYVADMKHLGRVLSADSILAVNSDLPFITSEIVDMAIDRYWKSGKPALTVMIPTDETRKLGFESQYTVGGLSPAGVNIIDTKLLGSDQADEEILIVHDPIPLLNVNSLEEVQLAEKLIMKQSGERHGSK